LFAAVSGGAAEDGAKQTQQEFSRTEYRKQYFHCVHRGHLQRSQPPFAVERSTFTALSVTGFGTRMYQSQQHTGPRKHITVRTKVDEI